jgi:ABC-2 type transport system permease protein
MAVHDQGYKRYTGPLTDERRRFLVLPRYALQEVFQGKLFLLLFGLACLSPLVYAVLIYLHHNLQALGVFGLTAERLREMLPIDATFFEAFVRQQGWEAFVIVLFAGPGLISTDLRNNGLPLYLARPLTRSGYVAGKLTVLVLLLSAFTWVPGLLLFAFQGYLEGAGWIGSHLRLAWAIFVSSWVWILVLSLLTLALSAWVKWKPVVRIALLALVFVFRGWGGALNMALDTRAGDLVSVLVLNDVVRRSLFGRPDAGDLPVWSAWLVLALGAGACLALLARRVRAYEVVR